MTPDEKTQVVQAVVEAINVRFDDFKADNTRQHAKLFEQGEKFNAAISEHLGEHVALKPVCAERHCALESVRKKVWMAFGAIPVVAGVATYLAEKFWTHVAGK